MVKILEVVVFVVKFSFIYIIEVFSLKTNILKPFFFTPVQGNRTQQKWHLKPLGLFDQTKMSLGTNSDFRVINDPNLLQIDTNLGSFDSHSI